MYIMRDRNEIKKIKIKRGTLPQEWQERSAGRSDRRRAQEDHTCDGSQPPTSRRGGRRIVTGIAVAADEMSAILMCSVLQTSDRPTPGSRLLKGHMSNPPGDKTLVVWTAPARSVECCIGLTNASRRPGAQIYTRSLAGAVAMGRFASPHLPPRPICSNGCSRL